MQRTTKMSNDDIKTLSDLEEFIGKEKLTKFFIEHYLKSQANTLQEIKLDDENFDINEILE